MTALGMLLAGFGLVLVWAAIRNRDPRELIASVIRPKGSR